MSMQTVERASSIINLASDEKRLATISPTSDSVGVVSCSRQQVQNNKVSLSIDSVIVEEPLQIRLLYTDIHGQEQDRIFLVTMRTPGEDVSLVTGLLLAEGVIEHAQQIVAINEHIEDIEINTNEIHVSLSSDLHLDWDRIKRDTTSFSSCGVCGKSSMQSLELRNIAELDTQPHWLAMPIIDTLSERLYQSQNLFHQTGGVHGCALFDNQGKLLLSAEDVGRHNALDKLLGKLACDSTMVAQQKIVFLSGRISFELVQKILVAGITVLAAVGAPSNLAINMAKRFNLTLIGFSRDGRFNIYHGAFRLNLTALDNRE
ncbi:formate dehydrogenase family accessory protein FdhD [Psychromonas sp. psych-6C06]|uniref:formate dehydrogenase accessory sulfurtransferase FdhD n=1 Tax=Psychromonas sp. psych-6C06 TaxID=2058089 RepID=UPI000C32AEA5|nr:formate dehydrogenase accessory sulfurtransferase FdhD [Psychromonas sp. psych-6C06]PKF60823.1 formate dehydrogenase family accessory protein FdhD [Psychromonas sp. psych-6C06]